MRTQKVILSAQEAARSAVSLSLSLSLSRRGSLAKTAGALGLSLLTLAVLADVTINKAYAAPATFTVTNTNDSGAGSLRQAILDANSNANPSDTDTITFNIPGSGVHIIDIGSTLNPTEPVIVNGYTQTGSSANTAISPAPINSIITIGLHWTGDTSNTLLRLGGSADGSEVRGLAIYGAPTALDIDADGATIAGNYLNTDTTGLINPDIGSTTRGANGANINGENVMIGGTNPADRNIITNSDLGGLSINANGVNTEFYGNYIGIGRDGVTDLDGVNGFQVTDNATGNHIGGASPGMRNVISGLSNTAVLLLTNGNVLQGNYIGADATGSVNSNLTTGVGVTLAFNATENLIGGVNSGEGNVIRGVSGAGITAIGMNLQEYSMQFTPSKNAILRNVISDVQIFDYPDFGDSNLGIDHFVGVIPTGNYPPTSFISQGPTPNDPSDSDTGPNSYMNTPVLKSAQQIGNQLTITYNLDAADASDGEYRVEFFANDESTVFGAGPAQEFIGSATVSNGTNQTATFTVSGDYTNKALSSTATAIDIETWSGFGSTSELSKNISVGSATDFDSDGSPDAVEDAGPNGGDANDDGIADKLQPTVTTYEIDSTGKYATFITEGCSENGTVASIDVSSLPQQDGDYEYPYGLTDFTLNCSRGDTVTVTKYIWDNVTPDNFIVRKYNPETDEYREIEDSTITTETVAGTTGLKLSYQITDGGDYDDDATENGIIVDPVGLAVLASSTGSPGSGNNANNNASGNNGNANGGNLANTGQNIALVMIAALALIVVGLASAQYSRQTSNKN